MRRPTLKEVSELAGVSVYTASRALAFHKGVAEKTKATVLSAAGSLGYVPNVLARNLKFSASRTIGVLTANNANRFYSTLVSAIQREVLNDGYTCFVSDAVDRGAYSVERENAFVSALLEQRVAGIILTYTPTEGNLALLKAWNMPIVFIDCVRPEGFETFDSVISDGHAASYDVGMRFAAEDRLKWLFVGHTSTWNTRAAREAGLNQAAEKHGAGIRLVEGGNDITTSYEAVSSHYDDTVEAELPNAILASNEPLLNGTLRALRERNVRIPEDTLIVGFDDFEWAEQLVPSISVVDQNVEGLGSTAASLLVRRMGRKVDGPEVGGAEHILPTVFIARRSGGGITL